MKLEVGKFYTVRYPKDNNVSKVRVDCIRPGDVIPSCRVACTVFFHGLGHTPIGSEYYLDGSFCNLDDESNMDLVAEYQEPELKLTPDDVGKRVKLANGDIGLIVYFYPTPDRFIVNEVFYTPLGQIQGPKFNTNLEIVEILD